MIAVKTCYEITCDRDCDGRGWDEDDGGTPHFDTEAEAIEYARSCGFVIVGGSVLCQSCARVADCERTGHQWGEWRPRDPYGVPCKRRECEHCGHGEYDQPFEELSVLVQAARIVNGDERP